MADPGGAPPPTVDSYISEEMQEAVGRELGRQVSYPIAESDIRRWAIAVYYPEEPPRLFWDAEYAAQTSHGGIVAPEEFNPFAWIVADPPGVRAPAEHDPGINERNLGIEPPPLGFQVHGGVEIEYGVRMRPGDVITAVATLDGYRERRGRLGLMLFTTMGNLWTNQDGVVVRHQRATVIRY